MSAVDVERASLATRHHRETTAGLAVEEIRQRVVGLDVKVPTLDGSRRPYINFDNAATTPAFWDVCETLELFLPWYSSIHRGTGFKSGVSTQAYDDARYTVGSFFGADPNDQVVIFVKNSTEAINKAARRIPLSPDDVVLVSLMEHHSNDLPWRSQATVVHAAVTARGELDLVDVRRKFAEYGTQIKLLAITGASNVTGAINPIHELAEMAHQHGAQILVDAAQLAPHRAVDIGRAGDPGHIDFLVASGHKLYAPFGTGALIGPRDLFGSGAPDYSGGGTVEIVTEDDVYWAAPPDRDEAGSPNVVGAVAMAAACRVLQEIGMDRLAAHETDLTRYTLEELKTIDGIELYGNPNAGSAGDRLGVIPFNVKGLSHYLVSAVLSTEYAIGVRNGCFCAHPYVLRLLDIPDPVAWSWRKQVISGVRAHLPGLVRISYGCYNSREEVDWLVKALREVACGEIAGDYQQDQATGTFWERGFRPEMEEYFKL
jgi:cysteine desulfurase/selenocysteine lyase